MGYFLTEDGSGYLFTEDGSGHLLTEVPLPAFPDPSAQLGIKLELNAGGTWADVTGDLDHGPVTIRRGHPDESTTVAPSEINTTLTNTDARYSPDNPMAPLWPWLVQNMPGRVSIPAASNYLRLEANNSDRAFVNDDTALHVTGSIELRWYGRLSDWQGCVLAGRRDGSTGSWHWLLNGDGTQSFGFWDSGGTFRSASSNAPLPNISGDFALKVTLDVSTGTVWWYTAATIDGTYTQLGDGQTFGGAVSLRAGNCPLVVGYSSTIGTQLLGRVYEFRLYNGIGGTVVADGLFSGQGAGAVAWTDPQGNTWNLAGGAEISVRDYRAHFECSEWPQEEPEYNPDAANNASVPVDALVPLVGGGLLRRLGQRAPNVSSAMYRAILAQTGSAAPVAYWPMEDASGATVFGSAVGGIPMTWGGGPPKLASSTVFSCSSPLPVMGSNGSGAGAQGLVPLYTAGGGAAWSVRFLMDVGALPAGGLPTLMQVDCIGGLGAYIVFAADPSGFVHLVVWDDPGNVLADTGAVAWTAGIQGPYLWTIQAQQSGSNVQYLVGAVAPGASTGQVASVTTAATGIPGYVAQVLPVTGGGWPDTVIGHVQAQPSAVSIFSLGGAANAHFGEPAGARFARLCAENSIACRTRGNLAATVPMGAQPAGTLTTLLQACADADQGVWTELRQVLGFGFVTRSALYNQAATATADYTKDHLSPWSQPPTRDDQTPVNDVTYSNDSGSSARATQASGRMGTASPANGGVGTYAQSYSVSIASDTQLTDLAGWKLNIGTVDQARLPGIMFDLASTDATSIYQSVVNLDLGDRLVISNPPRRLGFNPVTQLVQATQETLWHDTLSIGIAGVPELPYQVWQLDGPMRVAPDAAILSTGVNATATSWQVWADSADSTQVWSTNPADYPQNWMIDGELVTVTAVSGGSSPQTATVTRSVNNVVKSHLANAVIIMWPPAVIGL